MARISSVYPVVQVADPRGTADWFVTHFGFAEVFGADWYVSLRRGAHELAFLDPAHPTIPAGFGTPAAGMLVNIEVDDAAGEHQRLVRDAGLTARLALRDEDFGQRHFILEAPGRLLVDVIEEIPPSAEFAAAFGG